MGEQYFVMDVKYEPQGPDSAKISWRTHADEPSTSQVEYGTNPNNLQLSDIFDTDFVTDHHVELTGLQPGALYYYRAMSRRMDGKLSTSPLQSHSQPQPTMIVLVHLQGLGDRTFRENEFAGTRGESRRLEGFQLRFSPQIPGLSMRYMAHLQGIGDAPFVNEGQFVGTRGQSRRLEGFAIELTGPAAANYNVFYMAHLQGTGDTRLFRNREFCGTRGQSRRVEGMLVRVERK